MCFQEDAEEAVINLPFQTKSLAKNDFTLLKSKGTRIFGKSVKFNYILGSFEGIELGVTAFKKSGNAVARNYFKRIVKEAFRNVAVNLPTGMKLQVIPLLPLEKISYHTILEDLHTSLCTSIQNKKEQSKPLKEES
jgi:ribonuclease P protein component